MNLRTAKKFFWKFLNLVSKNLIMKGHITQICISLHDFRENSMKSFSKCEPSEEHNLFKIISVPDLDPDPHVFGPSGSGYISQRYGSRPGSGSFYHQAKIVRKPFMPMVPYCFVTSFGLFIFEK
jgi:hypothetical protein